MELTMDAMDLAFYRHQGHLTVNGVFAPAQMDAVIRDIEQWGETFLAELPPEKRAWFIDGGVSARTVLRKLDNPHFHRDAVQALARDPKLVGLVEQFLGRGVSVYFSQIFFKPPEGGGPKPATDIEGVVTAWIALDDATLENGCLYFGDGTNQGPVYPHFAPENEPFNLQLTASVLDKQPMQPAPVRKGGVSFHHGNTFHQSGPNHSDKWRRACALHFVRNDVEFATPALPYDHSLKFRVS
jgi:ectoine hydroxylase-related dioxygenase (phytanoyl-CoA dioxygenase family)